jgi:L-iditol 2-dehydrogenase
MTMDQAALSEPLAIGVYATGLSVPLKGKNIGILGSGPIGISVLLPALAMGARNVYMTDRIDARLDVAMKMGAHRIANPDKTDVVKEILSDEAAGLDVVFECCGKQEAVDQAISLLKPGGQLMIIGIPTFSRWSFDVDALRRKEINIQNVRRQNGAVEKTLEMIANGTVNPNPMQTHTMNFSRVREAFDLVANHRDGVVKAMINFSRE